MLRLRRLRRQWDWLLSSGEYPGETDIQRGKRRILVGYFVVGALSRAVFSVVEFGEALPGVGVVDATAAVVSVILLVVLRGRPGWFVRIVHAALFLALVEVLAATVILGGLVPSEMVILFGLLAVLGALIVLSIRAAFGWFLAFILALVLAVVLPGSIDPVHTVEGSPGGTALTVFGVTAFVFAAMAYFVRQRDRLQQQSDDLLHNILPDEIARRLKSDNTMIADHHESASVLFADVVDFTPMSAEMSPAEVVGLLNNVFTAFDRFTEELGLEKIKTVGDEYMVAAGVPRKRPCRRHGRIGAENPRPHRRQQIQRQGHTPAHRHQLGAGRRGGRRNSQVRIRPVGRRRQYREPHGVRRRAGIYPGELGNLRVDP